MAWEGELRIARQAEMESPGTEKCACRPSDGEAETGNIRALLACQLSLTDRSQDRVSKLQLILGYGQALVSRR